LAITATDANYAQGAVAFDVSNQPIAFSSVTVIILPAWHRDPMRAQTTRNDNLSSEF
jgi:hypothetical protein